MKRAAIIFLWSVAVVGAAALIYVLYIVLWQGGEFGFGGDGIAVLTRKLNVVNHRQSGSIVWGETQKEADLKENDAIRTGEQSVAEITFDEGPQITLPENSQIIIRRIKNDAGEESGSGIIIESGSAEFFNVASTKVGPAKKFNIETGDGLSFDIADAKGEVVTTGENQATLKVSSGEANYLDSDGKTVSVKAEENQQAEVEINKEKELQVTVISGKASIAEKGETIELAKNEALVVSKTGRIKKGKIPPAPPVPSDTLFTDTGEVSLGEPILRWEMPEGEIRNFLVNIYRENKQSVSLFSETVSGTSVKIPQIGAGRYLWNVAAFSDDGFKSAPSKLSPFVIYDQKELTAPELSSPDSGFRIKYLDSPREVTFKWKATGKYKRYRFQVSKNSDFPISGLTKDEFTDSASISLALSEGEYFWRVGAVAGTDYMGSFSDRRPMFVDKEIDPFIEVAEPQRYSVAFDPELKISGKAEPGGKIEISVLWGKKTSVTVGPDGSYSHTHELKAGANKITITTISADGDSSSRLREAVLAPHDLIYVTEFTELVAKMEKLSKDYAEIEKQIEQARTEGRTTGASSSDVGRKTRGLTKKLRNIDAEIGKIAAEIEAYL